MEEISSDRAYKKFTDIKRLSFILSTIRDHFPKEAKVLDVGCGNGIISIAVGKLGYSVLGIDVSEKAIQKANNDARNRDVNFKVQSAEELSVSNEKFDVVICSEVLEHLHRPALLVGIIHKLLNTNGFLIITVPNGIGPRELLVTRPMIYLRDEIQVLYKFVNWIKELLRYKGTTIQSDADNLDHIQFFKYRDLKKLAKSNNFDIIRIGRSNFVDDVFPVSLISRYSISFQKLDSLIADILPIQLSGGFYLVLKKMNK